VTGRRRKARRRPPLTVAAIQHLGDALSPCEALDCGDEEQRRAALSALSGRGDPEAIMLLRRAAASRDSDLALSAALVLDEISERVERRADRPAPATVRYGTG
jgi:HEAT repeat protein